MNENSRISLSLIFSLIAAIGVIYKIIRDKKSDNASDVVNAVQSATQFTQLSVKLDGLIQQFSDFVKANEKTIDKISILASELADSKNKIQRLMDAKKELEKRIEKLEGGK